MLTIKFKNLLATMSVASMLCGAPFAVADDKVPQTAAEHEAAADDFRNKAKGHRAEAEMHRKMAEMYQTQIKGPKNQKPNPWLINMVKHCKAVAGKADALAAAEEKTGEMLSKQAKAS